MGVGVHPTNLFTMTENEISHTIVNCCYKIHVKLGPGLLESVYEEILFHVLLKEGLYVTKQQTIPVIWGNLKIDQGFRADLIVENKVLVEIKSVRTISPVHQKQVLTYLMLTGLKLGLLINFNKSRIKYGISRIVNGL